MLYRFSHSLTQLVHDIVGYRSSIVSRGSPLLFCSAFVITTITYIYLWEECVPRLALPNSGILSGWTMPTIHQVKQDS